MHDSSDPRFDVPVVGPPPLGRTGNTTQVPKLKPHYPAPFAGDRKLFRGFILQLEMAFALLPGITDSQKINVFGSLLQGLALQWFLPFLESPVDLTWSEVRTRAEAIFADPNRRIDASLRIGKLRQGKDLNNFIADFNACRADLNWDEAALMDTFMNGLSEKIAALLLGHPDPETLEDLFDLAIRADAKIRAFEARFTKKPPRSLTLPATVRTPSSSAPSPWSGIPMDIDASSKNFDRKALREHRIQNDLCRYCGESGHYLKECPKRPRQIAVVEPTGPPGNAEGQ